jgi:xanthine dehydrogenase accessory factor
MWDWVHKLDELRQGGRPAAVITVIGCAGSTPCTVGAKMIALEGGDFHGTIGGGHLEKLALADAAACLASSESKTFRYPLGAKVGQCCGGVVDTFVEVVGAGPRLYLFGVGHVGRAVCRVLDGTPFHVHAIDERDEWLRSSELPRGVTRHGEAWDDFVKSARWDAENTYVAIMTHRHDTDQDIVADVIQRPAKYIGLIGSQTKWNRFRERLGARGVTAEKLARVKCPIGVDIGGKAPQEVAVSVAAELLKTLHGR